MIGLEEIYDAAFDQSRLPLLIERLTLALGAQTGFLVWTDTRRNLGFHAQYGNDPAWLQSYAETYAEHDVLRPHLDALPEGVCAPAWPLLQRPDIRESRFYREYLSPMGVVDNLAVNLIRRRGITAHVALVRLEPAAPFSEEDCATMAALIPHLRRAIYIQSHLVRAAEHAASAQAFAGGNNSGLMLVTAERDVIEADPDLVSLMRLRIGKPLANAALASALGKAIDNAEPVAIALPDNDETEGATLLLEARPLETDRFGDLAAGPGATHAIHVTRIDRPRGIAYSAIAALYGLTAGELRVLRDAIATGDLAGMGARLGIAPATTRTHLHRIYQKTDTASFAALANLVHRFGTVAKP